MGTEMDRNRDNGDRSLLSYFVRPIDNMSNLIFPIVQASDDDQRHPVSLVSIFRPKYDKVGGRQVREPWKDPVEGETGWDRIKEMFSTDEYGLAGPEWTLIINATYCGILTGIVFGGMNAAKRSKESFISRNQAVKFENEMQARRLLQDRITFGMFSGAVTNGLKVGGFSSIYVFGTTLLSVYRGKTSMVDFIAAGTISGALWRISMGPKAMVVSSALGTVLGIFAGALSSLAFYIGGTSMEELRYWHYSTTTHIIGKKKTYKVESSNEQSETDVNPKLSHHPDKINK